MTAAETPTAQFRTFLEGLKGLSAKRVDDIVSKFERHMPASDPRALLIDGAAVTVETVEAYGLEIELDANGRAGRVALAGQNGSASTPMDSMTIEYWDQDGQA
jgi:hypothetical protein